MAVAIHTNLAQPHQVRNAECLRKGFLRHGVSAEITASRTQAGPLAATSATQIQDRFLTLLVTQLKNQDPLNPAKNDEMSVRCSEPTPALYACS